MGRPTIPSSVLPVSEIPAPLFPLPPPPKIPVQPIRYSRKQSAHHRRSTSSPLRNESKNGSACEGSKAIGVEVPRRALTMPTRSPNCPLPSSSLIHRSSSTSEIPDAHHDERASLGLPPLLDQVAETSPITGRKKLVFNGPAFFSLKRYFSDDSRRSVASEDAPAKLSDVERSSERGFPEGHDPADVRLNNHQPNYC